MFLNKFDSFLIAPEDYLLVQIKLLTSSAHQKSNSIEFGFFVCVWTIIKKMKANIWSNNTGNTLYIENEEIPSYSLSICSMLLFYVTNKHLSLWFYTDAASITSVCYLS